MMLVCPTLVAVVFVISNKSKASYLWEGRRLRNAEVVLGRKPVGALAGLIPSWH